MSSFTWFNSFVRTLCLLCSIDKSISVYLNCFYVRARSFFTLSSNSCCVLNFYSSRPNVLMSWSITSRLLRIWSSNLWYVSTILYILLFYVCWICFSAKTVLRSCSLSFSSGYSVCCSLRRLFISKIRLPSASVLDVYAIALLLSVAVLAPIARWISDSTAWVAFYYWAILVRMLSIYTVNALLSAISLSRTDTCVCIYVCWFLVSWITFLHSRLTLDNDFFLDMIFASRLGPSFLNDVFCYSTDASRSAYMLKSRCFSLSYSIVCYKWSL